MYFRADPDGGSVIHYYDAAGKHVSDARQEEAWNACPKACLVQPGTCDAVRADQWARTGCGKL